MSTADRLVLVVDDEAPMRRLLVASLEVHGYRTIEADAARTAIERVVSDSPDIVLLDLGLPDADGLEVTARLREWTRVPIIVLSARGLEADKVRALDVGADDYLTKPFGIEELLARIRVAERHARSRSDTESPLIVCGPIRVDVARHEVVVDGRPVRLTPTEFALLRLLAQHGGKVLTHRQILREVWGPAATDQTHYVRVHMAELRKKIEANPSRPRFLMTEQGVGYRLRGSEGLPGEAQD